ncbi:transposase [Bifidobacterium samirii]|uniref:Transposase n=1 Tax=Bifidobacterium samirii TaxID=2306974 RepID=A0A430FW81_9BIFI|nr:transposase [Bifidobacterium samirii]
MKAAYIDAYRGRFGVGPICRVLSGALDCGFLTERGYRMFKRRPPSRMTARHEALARDILMIREDEFMRVYGYRKVWHQLVRQGWDPKEIGRDQVARIMRMLGVQGVRGGRRPVTTIPAKGRGGRLDLVERKFAASAPNRLHVADITYVRLADGSFAYVAFVTDAFARRIVGWAVAGTMRTEDLPLQALDQAVMWARRHGGAGGCVHHSDHGSQYISLVYSAHVADAGMLPSTGTVGDSYDNALAERTNNSYKRELVWVNKPYRTVDELEYATMRWVSWYNSKRLHASLGYRTPQDVENEYYRQQTTQAVS